MQCQILFSGKNKKNISKCRLLKILPRALSVNKSSVYPNEQTHKTDKQTRKYTCFELNKMKMFFLRRTIIGLLYGHLCCLFRALLICLKDNALVYSKHPKKTLHELSALDPLYAYQKIFSP